MVGMDRELLEVGPSRQLFDAGEPGRPVGVHQHDQGRG